MTRYVIRLTIFLCFVLLSNEVISQNYQYYNDSDGVIKEKCLRQWPEDYQMQEYCIKSQKEAVGKLMIGCPSDIPYDVFIKIRNKCGAQWLDDYQMREYCEKTQYQSWRNINQ